MVNNFTIIVNETITSHFKLVALHLTTYFQVMDWNKHKNEVSLMDITIAGSINACS